MRSQSSVRTFIRYGAAIGLVGLAFGLDRLLPWLEHPSPLFLAAVSISVWFGGFGPGLLATVMAALGVQHFYAVDMNTGNFRTVTWVWPATFVFAAILINWLHMLQQKLASTISEQNRRQVQFLSVVAHELRNFLHPVSTAMALLRRKAAQDPAIEQSCATVERQVKNMARLIEDLLDIARINEGKLVLQRERIDLRDALAQAAEAVQPQVQAHELHLETRVPTESLPIEADRTRLDQVLMNLLTNAVKHTPPGGRIELEAGHEGSEVVVRVRDTGSGLAPELLPCVFDLFVQGEGGSRGGLGIGLALVRGVVQMHGGSVAATSAGPGLGSEFVVRLPTH